MPNLKNYRKCVVAVAGLLAQAVALGVLPPDWEQYASTALAALTALGVYVAPNTDYPVEK